MSAEPTTAAVQRYLDALAGDQPAEPIVRALLDRSVRHLQLLRTNLLYHKYRRLTLPPLNLQPDEMIGAVVERLLKAMRSVHPQTVRQFFALVNQHMRPGPRPANTGRPVVVSHPWVRSGGLCDAR